MYNAEMKKSFLNTIVNENSYKAYIRIFNAIENMEDGFGKDVCEMSVDEIISMLSLKTGAKANNAIQTISLLKSYVDWCIQNGKIVGENNLEKVDFKDLNQSKSMRNQYLKDEEDFEEMCREVYKINMYYNESVKKPEELMVRLLFHELELKEIILLKKTDVDYENKIIHSPIYPISYDVSDKELLLCDFCAKQNVALSSNGREEGICDNDYLIRSRTSGLRRGKSEKEPISIFKPRHAANDFCRVYNEETDTYRKVTQTKLIESHMLMRIHRSDNPIKFISTEIKKETRMRIPDIKENTLEQRIYRLKKLYNSWEEAFY